VYPNKIGLILELGNSMQGVSLVEANLVYLHLFCCFSYVNYFITMITTLTSLLGDLIAFEFSIDFCYVCDLVNHRGFQTSAMCNMF